MFHVRPASGNPDLWDETHNHVRAARATLRLGAAQTYPLPVNIIYGLTPDDTRGLDPTSEDECWRTGSCVSFWDTTFDPSSEAAQLHLLETCDLLLSDPARVRSFPSLECPLYAWRDYLVNRGETFPASRAAVARHLRDWVHQLSWPENEHVQYDYARGRLAWLRIRAYSTMNSRMGPVTLSRHYDEWEAFMAARNEGAPPGVADGFQLADKYMEMDTLLNLVSTGLTSTLLSCVLALVVLLLFTGDLVVALLAFACVGLTVCTVLGLMVMRDEPMRIVESVVLAILVGMAVDYVVHLGVAFVEADVALGPHGRTAEALGRMGQPILSGAGTTIITAASLFLPRMITFNTFGRFIVTIVGVSCVQAMVYFPMLLMHFGPRSRRCSFSIPRTMRLVLALSDRGTAKAAQHTPAVGGGAADSSRAEAAGEAASPSW